MNEIGKSIGPMDIPFTFPTNKVLNAIQESLPVSAENWTKLQIDDMYALYLDAVKDGKPIYNPPKDIEAKQYMINNSNYSDSDIRVFLYMLYTLAKDGKIDQKYWNIELQEKRGLPGLNLDKNITQITGAVKWGSIALVAGAALYLLWPYIKKRRR